MGEEYFVDEEMEPDPRLNAITNAIIGAGIKVHRSLGSGQLESAYEEAMAIEMELRGIRFARQVAVSLLLKEESSEPDDSISWSKMLSYST